MACRGQTGQETRGEHRCNALSEGADERSAGRRDDGERRVRHTDGVFVAGMGRECCYYGSDCGSGEESQGGLQPCDPISEYGRPAGPASNLTAPVGALGMLAAMHGDGDSSGLRMAGMVRERTGTHGTRTGLTTDTPAARQRRGSFEVRLPIYIDRGQIARTVDSKFRSVADTYHPTPQIPESVSLRNRHEHQVSRARPLGQARSCHPPLHHLITLGAS